jgi:predicted MFS family arabinose efflux permease
MRDDQLFGVVAAAALLIWLGGRRLLPDSRPQRRAEAVALGIVAVGILYALVRTFLWFGGSSPP